MNNHNVEATWHYHNGTKHPGGYLLNHWHAFDPARQPLLFKIYTGLEPIPLPLDTTSLGMPALSAISTTIPTGQERIPDLDTLARILYFSAGITKRIKFPPAEMLFRAAACTGALYHIELYVVCGELAGLGAGVYHFDPQELALRRLRPGDYRRILVEASGNEPDVAKAPAIIVYTDIFWRNACKYQAREYRHAFWDSGTILSHTLAISAVHGLPATVVAGFVDSAVNRLLDLDIQQEVALALLPIGQMPNAIDQPLSNVKPNVKSLTLQTVPISDYQIEFPAIGAMHEASSLMDEREVTTWRGHTPSAVMPAPSGQLSPLQPHSKDETPHGSLEAVIIRRGSTRQFSREAITFQQLSTILYRAIQGIPADFLEPPGTTLNQIYLIVNAVEDLVPGAYVLHQDRQALELLKEGNFRSKAGQLGLGQALPADASVDIFFLTELNPVLARLGNRGYRVAQLDASIMAGRIYLAAYAQRLGATGLTFFDDAVTEFFSPHAQDKSVMFLIALGKRAKQRPV
jgi:SagB-type dehydrogenase family enzyme